MRKWASRGAVVGFAAALALLWATVAGEAQGGKGEWRAYGGDPGARKYSPLDQINRNNVKSLRIAWRQSAVPAEMREGRPNVNVPSNYEHTPLMVGGLLYVSTGIGVVAALEPTTGKVVWAEEVSGDGARGGGPGGGANRSLAFWSDGKDARVLSISGGYLTALNAKSGRRYADFGQGGRIDLTKAYERPVQGFRWNSPPAIVKDVIVVGGVPAPATDIINENMKAVKESPPGDFRGYDVRTGKLLWTFHVVPRPGEFGYDTWLNNSADYSGNSGTWSWFSADEELGYLYLATEEATGDFFGGFRPGNDLFAESLVCLDAKTGKRIWHFQAVHHGIWDYDFPTAPVLLDVTVNGRRIKAVAAVSKQAFVYAFDRVTGTPLWPIEERPVPQGTTPGEHYSPTQPFPTRPPAVDMQGLTLDDLIDFTPALRQEAVKVVSQYRYGPLFTPASPDKPTVQNPGTAGGPNWNGSAADPETGILYVPTVRNPTVVEIVKSKNPESTLPFVRKGSGLDTNLQLPNGLPAVKPPYGSLVAIDMNKGEILWKVPNGNGPRDHPALKSLNLPPLGTLGRASALVTKTLLFIGEGMGLGAARIPAWGGGKMFRAYDKKTGQVIWETELPGGTTGAPMTYMANGKQYIVVAVGWEKTPAELVALALP
jgi:quinoprotein glucose dehydrogenase